MSAPYIAASTPQIFLSNDSILNYPPPYDFGINSFHQGSPFQNFQLNSGTDLSYSPRNYVQHPSYEELHPQQVPYRGVGLTSPESLNFSVANRKGAFAHISSLSGYSTGEENPSLIKEHIQERDYSKQEAHQDLQGLDIIRVQATRIDHLLDKIEILEREIERQTEIQREKDRDIEYWEKQYGILEENRDDANEQMDGLAYQKAKQDFLNYMDDKAQIERKINHKLKEIEDMNLELNYYKNMSAPKDNESNEIKRLQQIESQLLQESTNINKRLLAISHTNTRQVQFQ